MFLSFYLLSILPFSFAHYTKKKLISIWNRSSHEGVRGVGNKKKTSLRHLGWVSA
jgi:hypothetical protein